MTTFEGEYGQRYAKRTCVCTGGKKFTEHLIACGLRQCLECGRIKLDFPKWSC